MLNTFSRIKVMIKKQFCIDDFLDNCFYFGLDSYKLSDNRLIHGYLSKNILSSNIIPYLLSAIILVKQYVIQTSRIMLNNHTQEYKPKTRRDEHTSQYS